MNNELKIVSMYNSLISCHASKLIPTLNSLDAMQLTQLYDYISAHKVKSNNNNYMKDELLSIMIERLIDNKKTYEVKKGSNGRH